MSYRLVVSRKFNGGVAAGVNRLAWVGPLTVVVAVAAVLLVRFLAVLVLIPQPQFTPLGWALPAIDTAVLVAFAVLIFGAIASAASNPIRTFRRLALIILLVSFLPAIAVVRAVSWGGNWSNALALMIMHTTAWAVCVTMLPILTRKARVSVGLR